MGAAVHVSLCVCISYNKRRLCSFTRVVVPPRLTAYARIYISLGDESRSMATRTDPYPRDLVACVVSGQLRTMLSSMVHRSFVEFVPPCSVHAVISGQLDRTQRGLLEDLYRPISLRAMNITTNMLDLMRCPIPGLSARRVLVAWIGIREAFTDLQQREAKRGFSYAWVLRLRTDVVYFKRISVHNLDPTYVYLPRGGMTVMPRARFANDHLFICPRGLCPAYFNLPRCGTLRAVTGTRRPATSMPAWAPTAS